MASDKVDMSLDDIIKSNKPQQKLGGRQNFNHPTRRETVGGRSGYYNNQQNRNFGVARGRVTKATSRYDRPNRASNRSDLSWLHNKNKWEAAKNAMGAVAVVVVIPANPAHLSNTHVNPRSMGSRLGVKLYRRNNFHSRGRYQRNNRQNQRQQQRPRQQQQNVQNKEMTKKQLDADLDGHLNKMDH